MPIYKLSRNSEAHGMGGRNYVVVENRKRRYHESLGKRVPN